MSTPDTPVAKRSGQAQTGPQTIIAYASNDALPRSSKASYATYREIRRDPTIALARALSFAPVIAAEWSVTATRPGVPEERIAFVRDQFMPIREPLVRAALEGMCDFGWAPFEKVFAEREDRIIIQKFRPLLVDITEIRVDSESFDFRGFRQRRTSGQPLDLDFEYCLLFNDRGEGTNWYGEPLLENARKAWGAWDDCDKGASRYDRKCAGSHFVVHFPEGRSADGVGGPETDNAALAQRLLTALESSGSVAIPASVQTELNSLNAGAPIPQWSIELLADSSPRQASFIDRLRYIDALKARALLLPERVFQEGQFGTKAEAEAHTASAVQLRELDHRHVTRIVNWHAVDQLLAQNWGEDARGSVALVAAPLASDQKEWLRTIYSALLANPAGFIELAESLDAGALGEAVGVPMRQTIDPAALRTIPLPEPDSPPPGDLTADIAAGYARAMNADAVETEDVVAAGA